MSSFEAVPYAQFHSRPIQLGLEQKRTSPGLSNVLISSGTLKPKLVVAGSEPAKGKILPPGNLESTDHQCQSLRLGSDPRGAHSSGEMVKDRPGPS